MILRLLLPHERFFSSLVFVTVAHSAPSLGIVGVGSSLSGVLRGCCGYITAPERPARQQCSAHPAAAKLSAAASATFGGASKVPVRMVSGAVRRPAAATPFRAVRTAATVAADKAVALESEVRVCVCVCCWCVYVCVCVWGVI